MTHEMLADQSIDRQKELAALARMVTFARRAAQSMNIELPTYCLNLALDSIIEEMKIAGIDVSSIVGQDASPIVKGYH